MRAACRAAVELASLFFFGGCTVTRQQYPGSFGAGGTAQCSHRLVAAAARSAAAVRGRCRRSRTLGPPRGREFRQIRTRWREISAAIAVFPPSVSPTPASCSHPESQRQKPPPSAATVDRSRGPSAVRPYRPPFAVPRLRPFAREGVSADPHPMEGDFRWDCSFPSFLVGVSRPRVTESGPQRHGRRRHG